MKKYGNKDLWFKYKSHIENKIRNMLNINI